MSKDHVNADSRRMIPSTSMLLAFDTAARLGSFTKAAHELHQTQGAVSRQVSALESQLGVRLFNRQHKTITLTEVGSSYARDVHDILRELRRVTLKAVTQTDNQLLNLAILPTFGTKWLIPRLSEFLTQYPSITMNFISKLERFDLAQENIHAAIHYGLPDWPNCSEEYLMAEQTVPVCSAEFFRQNIFRQDNSQSVEDLMALPLLHLESRPSDWSNWFASYGLPYSEPPVMQFEQFYIMTQAATANLGVALMPKFLVQTELKAGDLIEVPVDGEPVKTLDKTEIPAYYLIFPDDQKDYKPLIQFKEWLVKCCNRPL
ncbi:LysR substrate-binding domain-containing protein [Porticoccus sp. W117]|uniref:LysR substrate-binding domain-containing protein n=1 Tax=Porticoccus sp. W117 TaxID=3054777 RepID=UPI002598BE80|nr:LysR substrate-binding domain-containing protein [Porticoccus sp. W117]MDM3871196.1 LysR substrate-binding domain-containing protein [Porticoccus sp. W117]